jgi:hypothetical protein
MGNILNKTSLQQSGPRVIFENFGEQLAVLAWDDDQAGLRVPAAAAQTLIVYAGEFWPSQRE